MSASSLQVIITRQADADEAAIYQYILKSFGETYAENFRKKFIIILQQLALQAFLGRPAKNTPTLRVFVLNKHNKIVYLIEDAKVVILRVLTMKQDVSDRY